ncbi:unnamed protein product [Hymenolepis diminuta]|uniref:TPR_REGION domain-containing protein n=2 Tax=Hymenolepis diminuta TaxID=6216 RepID=A0A0R3SH22_HYMDI|nr:unnamed protein product [Hymenolepis diminuta]
MTDMIYNTRASAKKILKKDTTKSKTTSSDGPDCIDFNQFNASLIVGIELILFANYFILRSLLDTYLEFQSHLRFPIANAVLKMFNQVTMTALEESIQDFLDDLKIYLMQEARKSLSTLAELQQGSGNVPSLGGLNERDFLYFAEEAEFLGSLQNAKYYIEGLFAKYGKTQENLLAAASLYARLGNREEAIVCLKWSLETNPYHIRTLMCLGVLLAELSKLDEAKRILEAASDIEPNDVSVWIILGLFYESINDAWNYERTNVMLKQMKSEIDKNDEIVSQDTDETIPEYVSSSDLINTFDLLLQLHAKSFIDRGLARLLLHIQKYRMLFGNTVNDKGSTDNLRLPKHIPRSTKNYANYMLDLSTYYRLNALFILQSSDHIGRLQEAESELKNSLQVEPESAENWCLMGLLRCLQMDAKAASGCFEMAMQLETWPVQNHRLYRLKLAQCYAEIENMNELEDAKLAFEESNRLNNREAIVWAYLTMICLKTGKALEAEECLKIIDKLGLIDEAIKTELEQIKLEEGKGSE